MAESTALAAASSSAAAGPSNSAAPAPSEHRGSNDMHNDEEVDYGDRDGEEMTDEDRELEAMKARVKEMEAEAAKLREMQAVAEKEMAGASGTASPSGADSASAAGEPMSAEDKEAVDARSIYVGNVDYGATPEEIQQHFASCGTINRVTILCDKYTGPKGYAYVEFSEPSLVENALSLNESMFRGRLLKVTAKRTNLPSFMLGRGRGGRGRAGYRGGRAGFRGGYNPYGGGPPRGRGRGRGGY